MEQQLAARLGERQITEFVKDHDIDPGERVGEAPGAAGTSLGLGLGPVDQRIDDDRRLVEKSIKDSHADLQTIIRAN